jgi:PAS domain S-box-containing protein
MSGDVGELVKDFNRMITQLATTTVKKERLEASEARYSSIFNSTTDSLVIFDDNGMIVEANPQACSMYGYSYEEIVKLSGKDIVHPNYYHFFEQFKKDVQTIGEFHAEAVDIRKDGSTFNVEVSGNMFNYGDSTHLLAVIRDVTSRKQADKLIRAQRDLGLALVAATGLDAVLRLCVEAAINITGMDCGWVYLVDEDSGAINLAFHMGLSAAFVNCVSRYDRDSDYTRLVMAGEPVYRQYKEIMPDTDNAMCNEKLRAVALVPVKCEGRVIGCLNISSYSLDKVPDFARSTLESISTQIGSVIARATANAKLNKEKERFRVLVEESPFGISLIKKDGHYEYINPKFTKLFGYTLKDIPTRKEWFKKAYPDMGQRRKAVSMWFQVKKNTKQGKSFQHELKVTCKDDSKKTIFFRMVNMEAGQDLVLYEDITKTKQLEKQFQQAQKMEAIGTLAGGIAHDFNNLLMGIQGRASLITMDIDSAHPYFEHLKAIEESVKSATGLTNQLLGFARAGRYEVKPIDLNAIIKKSCMMFARTKKEINIHEKYQKDIWTVKADQGQMEQMLLNLYVNAWQAMPGGGEIYLKTENIMIDKDYNKTYRIESGRYAKISITDTGMGMDEATQQKVFDPFFTTKEMGRGTGLGLASVYGIIKHHGGFINVYSEKGEGSTFNIYLPASTAKIRDQEATISKKQILRGDETVLFVDDENMIIDVGKQLLKMMGYKILTAKNGKEAIDIYKKNMDKIDMVILDMIMPDIGGSEVYDRLKEINPEIKVLLSSGYSINGQATKILNRGCNGFIQKPFNITKLSNKLRKILDRRETNI